MMKTIDYVIEQCEEIANASKQHTLHMTHFSQSYDEWAEEWTQIAEWLKELKAYKEQGGDAISRQAAVNAIYDLCGENVSLKENPFRDNPHMDAVVDELENLPSVTPQPKLGRWIDSHIPESMLCECSECGFTCDAYSFNYCPNCGAKMEVK